jgi:hypothetical protein
MERVVADTSVLVSAILSKKGDSFRFIKLLLEGKVKNYINDEILDEFLRVLLTKFSKLLPVEFQQEFYYLVKSRSTLVQSKEEFKLCRDRADNKFLEVVYASKAEYLLTLDKDLLDLRDSNRKFQIKEHEFKILKPEEFFDEIESEYM